MLSYPNLLSLNAQDASITINTTLAISAALFLSFLAIRQQLLNNRGTTPNTPKGCKRLGLPPGQSNLHDEFNPKYSQSVPESSTDDTGPAWRVKALFAYPIKSCAGVELDHADVVPTGFEFDRQFCFAECTSTSPASGKEEEARGGGGWTARTLRDRDFNRMALIRPEIWVPDPTAADYTPELGEVRSRGVMVIYFPRVARNPLHSVFLTLGVWLNLLSREESFRVPLFPPPVDDNDDVAYPIAPVKIWKDNPLAYDYGRHIPESLRRFLSPSDPERESGRGRSRKRLTLFRVHPSHQREIFRCAPRKDVLGFQPVTGFADAYPLHILNLASVHDVAARCAVAKDPLPRLSVRRFRANVIVQGPGAFVEDHWKVIRVSRSSASSSSSFSGTESGIETEEGEGTLIHTVCRTVRCRLPNVDPETGVRHASEPDRTLKSYRRIDAGDPTNACLGMQGVPGVEEFRIHVGDKVSVVETGEHFYLKMLAPGEGVPGV